MSIEYLAIKDSGEAVLMRHRSFILTMVCLLCLALAAAAAVNASTFEKEFRNLNSLTIGVDIDVPTEWGDNDELADYLTEVVYASLTAKIPSYFQIYKNGVKSDGLFYISVLADNLDEETYYGNIHLELDRQTHIIGVGGSEEVLAAVYLDNYIMWGGINLEDHLRRLTEELVSGFVERLLEARSDLR